jgi:hypothetical protein
VVLQRMAHPSRKAERSHQIASARGLFEHSFELRQTQVDFALSMATNCAVGKPVRQQQTYHHQSSDMMLQEMGCMELDLDADLT